MHACTHQGIEHGAEVGAGAADGPVVTAALRHLQERLQELETLLSLFTAVTRDLSSITPAILVQGQ